ncbi:MAG: protein TolQ [Alphaproteobacteria bacterium]
MNETLKTTELVQNAVNTDMSIIGLISHADSIVKMVIIILIIFSLVSWAIIFDKLIKFKMINNVTEKFEKLFWSGQLLEQLYERLKGRTDHPFANVFISAMHEWSKYNKNSPIKIEQIAGIKERIYQSMNLSKGKEIDKLEKNTNFLATAASSAPFIGLFGTVWGIMHSFQSIAATKNTTLAVVAPGIAEALLATAIGLIAAIPAAIFYNVLVSKNNQFANRIEDFSNEIGIILSRELDERM